MRALNGKSFFSRPLVHMLLIAALGAIVYSNAFDGAFHFDDYLNIVDNPAVKNMRYIAEPSRAKAPLGLMGNELFFTFKNRIVGFFTFALNYSANGLDVTGYHVVNLSVHLLNALLVYMLVVLTFRTPHLASSPLRKHSRHIAFLTALFFVSHPVQTQAVTYISQRFTSLVALFYLLSLTGYIASRLSVRKGSRHAFYALSIVSAVLAMKTKEVAFTLPMAIALFESMFFKGPARRRILLLLPILLSMLIIPLSSIDFDRPVGEALAGATRTQHGISRHDYLMTQFRVIVTYLRLLALPVNQNLDYDYRVFHSFFDPQVLSSFLLLSCIFSLGVYLFYRPRIPDGPSRLLSFGVLWFFLTLSIESSIIALADVIFEHRLYLPSLGVFLTLSTGALFCIERIGNKKARKVLVVSLALIIFTLSYASYSRNSVWRSETSLWQDAVRKSPGKARVHYYLGNTHMVNGDMKNALREFKTALHLDFEYAHAYFGLATVYRELGQLDRSIRQLRIYLELIPADPRAYNDLGLAHALDDNLEAAISAFKRALEIDPSYKTARENLTKAAEKMSVRK
jgi:tetratricopeptide (TPR) repeat protein